MDGYEVAKRIRAAAAGPGHAAAGDDGLRRSGRREAYARAQGFDYHLVKPVDPDYLSRLISDGV